MIIVERYIDFDHGVSATRTAAACDTCRRTGPWVHVPWSVDAKDAEITAQERLPKAWAIGLRGRVLVCTCPACQVSALEEEGETF